MNVSIASPLPPLQPILRRHLLHLHHGPIVLRPLQRADLAVWRRHHQRTGYGGEVPRHLDAEAHFLGSVQRSQLLHDNDQLLLGTFDGEGELLDQLNVRLHCAHSRSAELRWVHATGCAEQRQLQHALRALCPFLFEQVGLRRLFALLPAEAGLPLARTLQAIGFQREGILRDYHLGAEGWQDRQLHALTAPAWPQQPCNGT